MSKSDSVISEHIIRELQILAKEGLFLSAVTLLPTQSYAYLSNMF